MAQKVICDKCHKEILERYGILSLTMGGIGNKYDLCNNCYQTLIRVLAEYLPQ